MKKFLTLAAALVAASLTMIPEDASARPFGGGGWRGGGFRGAAFHGGFRGGGFRHAAIGGFRHAGWGYRRGWGGGWGWGAGALAAGALIGTAAAASAYPYGYGYGYPYGGYYPASYGWGGCGQQLAWVQTPYGWRRAWISTCY